MWWKYSQENKIKDGFFGIVPEHIWELTKNKKYCIKKDIELNKKTNIPYTIYVVYKNDKSLHSSRDFDECKDYILKILT